MKLVSIILVVLAVIAMAAWPPQLGKAQDSSEKPTMSLSNPIDTTGLSPATKELVDSVNQNYLRISAKTDSVITLARELENKLTNQQYVITEYKPPLAVMRIRFENKTILAQYD